MVPEEMLSTSLSNKVTRRNPWEIQQLVSTQELPHKSNGEGVLQTNSNPNCQVLTKFHFGRGGGVLQTNSNPKCQTLTKFSFQGWGRYSRPTQIQSIKSWPNFYFPGWGEVLKTNTNPKSFNLAKFSSGGEGYPRPTFLKYLSGGAQRNFELKILVTGMW